MTCPVRQKQYHISANMLLQLKVLSWVTVALLVGVTTFCIIPTQPASANRALPTDLSYSTETTWLLPGLPNLSATAGYIPHTFSQTETAFSVEGETTYGFRPGKAYDERYVRNIPWEIETAQYFYPDNYLRQPIEAFLRRQYASTTVSSDGDAGVTPGPGAIGGIITPQGQANKQTVTSDEETSLIHAAYLYYNLTYNTAWLESTINGHSVIDRLNMAAMWLYSHRLDPQSQLFWRGHTTDWGTVKTDNDPNYSDFDPTKDRQTISVYDQALAHMALLELAEMNAAVGNNALADQWQERAENLKKQTNVLLWQVNKGFYLTHAHITPMEHNFDETAMVSISNAMAAYTGLTDAQQRRTIFQNLENAQIAAEAKKPGLSIYPYYPNYIFAHPSMRRGFYQNGGLWDWWGGLQIKAEFLTGFSQIALTHLLQVANEWQKHPGNIIEWQSTTNTGQEGSHYFTAAAGTMGSAIIEGLFGIELDGGGLTLQPRLGLNDGYIRVYQPATDRYAAYSYDWSQNITRLDYGTNATGAVLVKVLKLRSEHIKSITIDEYPVEFELETIGNDSFAVFTAPEGQHSIEITKGQPPAQPGEIEPVTASETDLLSNQPPAASLAPNINSPHQTELQNPSTGDNSEPLSERYVRESRQEMLQLVGIGTVFTISIILFVLVLIRRTIGLNRQRSNHKPSQSSSRSTQGVSLSTPPTKNQSTH